MRVGILLLGCLLAAGCRRQDESGAAPPPAEVGTLEVTAEKVLLTNELPGRTVARLKAEIRPQANGIIQKRLFTEGADVEAGEVLYEIDPRTYEAAYENAEAAVAVAKANHETAKTAVVAAHAGHRTALAARDVATSALASAKANRSRAEAAAVPLRLRLERFRELVESKAVSQQDVDDISAALQEAEAGIESAEAAVMGAQADIGQAQAAIEASKADVQQAEAGVQAAKAAIGSAEASLQTTQINLDYARVKAPISGRIGRSTVTTGALVTAHQPTALAVIQQLDPIYVDVPQASADLLRLQKRRATGLLSKNGTQSKVELILEDGTAYPHAGTLQFRDVSVDPSTGSFILRMVFPNPEGVLLPGMFVRAVVEEGVKDEAILVPQQSVARDSKGDPFVLVVDAEEKVRQQSLTIDREVDGRWLVASGLNPGDRVIVEGTQKARPGASVKAVRIAADAESAESAAADHDPSSSRN